MSKSSQMYYFPSVNDDLYQTPSSDPSVECRTKREVSSVVIEHLRCTRPWVKFCSLAGFITALFILVVAAITVMKMLNHYPPMKCYLLGAFYIVLAVLFTLPSLLLSKYERTITRLLISERTEDLEQAISHQRTFWKQMGLIILIILILFLVTISLSAIVLLTEKF
ncbi:MAG: hypothetical protein ACPG32_12545 [Akkermansiaceae bacterium]